MYWLSEVVGLGLPLRIDMCLDVYATLSLLPNVYSAGNWGWGGWRVRFLGMVLKCKKACNDILLFMTFWSVVCTVFLVTSCSIKNI